MPLLAEREKKLLLQLARNALVAAVDRRPHAVSPIGEERFERHGGAFVTLFISQRLRGCIGELAGQAPLSEIVGHCARAVANQDRRFDPVRPDELRQIEIEISILSELSEILPEQIEVGRHGLCVIAGGHRGVLLPQVAPQFHWTKQRLLEATCEKAGLAADAWRDAKTQVLAFTAQVFSESQFPSSC